MCLKHKEEVTNSFAQINLIENDYGIAFEFIFLLSISREKFMVFLNISFFLKRYGKKKSHNILCLMLDPKFKSSEQPRSQSLPYTIC
jgi:hypothetical protein